MNVSIIIVNYNTKELLQHAITTIYQYTKDITFEIIVVDNASKDNPSILIKEKFPQVKFIRSSENIGFGRANNLGAEIATGEVLFLLNSDTILIENSIKKMYEYMKSHPDTACVGGILLNSDQEEIHSYSNFPTPKMHLTLALSRLKMHLFRVHYKIFKSKEIQQDQKPFEVPYITGADLMIRKSVWEQTGGFDPNIFMYCEESELQYRISLLGYKRIILPDTHIIHLVGKSCTVKHRARMMHMESTLYYLKKYSVNQFSYFSFRIIFYILCTLDFDKSYTKKERKEYLSLLNPFKNKL